MAPNEMPPDEEGPASAGVAHINEFGKSHFDGVMHCRWTENKGRVLHATRAFEEGEIILRESPLHIVQEEEKSRAFNHLKKLCTRYKDEFDYDPLWYWCALKSLTQADLNGAKLEGWGTPADPATQHNLLLLHHDEDCEPSRSSQILVEELVPGTNPLLVERLTQVWVLNCFEYSDSPQGYSTYFYSSFMSHSCWPNAVWHYDGTDHMLRARRRIEVGDEVCISYLPEHGLMQSAPVRRLELHDTKRFWCDCERCSGRLDLSRGLVCPYCGNGKVFARTPDHGPAKDDTLLSSHLVGATCDACGQAVSKRDATKLAGHEKKLKGIVEDLTNKVSEGQSVSLKDLKAHETFIETTFAQHVLSDLAWEQLAECYQKAHRSTEQRQMLELRCKFHEQAYPGLNGSHAWSLEAHGDAMMRASRAKQSKAAAKKVWQPIAEDQPGAALELYTKAKGILQLMFGEEHEYVTHVQQKYKSALRVVDAAKDRAEE